MEKAKLAALQSKIKLYHSLIAKHDEQKAKKQSAFVNRGSSANSVRTLSNMHGKVTTQTNVKITQSNSANQPVNLKFTNGKLSSHVSDKTFHNRTVIINKSPVFKPCSLNPKKLSFKPFVKNSSLSWSSTHKYINDYTKKSVLYKKANVCVGNSLNFSNVPKLQVPRSSLKNNLSPPSFTVKSDCSSKYIVKNTQSFLSIRKTPVKKEISKSHPASFCDELTAMIAQLKNANKTLSSKNLKHFKAGNNLNTNGKICTKLVSSSNLASGHVAKNIVSSVLTPKRSYSGKVPKLSTTKFETTLCKKSEKNLKIASTFKAPRTTDLSLSCITKDSKLIPVQSMENLSVVGSKLLASKPETCFKPMKGLEKKQIITVPKTPVSVKRKVTATKLFPLKSRITDQCSVTLRTTAVQECSNTRYEPQLQRSPWALQRKIENKPFKTKTKLLNSKYKVVNKLHTMGNVKSSSLESPSLKSLKTVTPASAWKGKSVYKCVQRSKKSKIVDKFNSYPRTSVELFSNKLYLKPAAKKNFKPSTPLKRPKAHSLNSRSKCEYQVINNSPNKSWSKVSKGLKSDSTKSFNFSTDVDLLMELAAEKRSHNNSTPKPQNRSVLLKRLYKSKNTIINKNVSSARVKTAKMIKSKYFASNKRYLSHKQAKFRNFSNFKNFQGEHKSFHTKFHASSFCNRKVKRNPSRHKFSNYATTSYFPRNVRKGVYPQNKLSFGTLKSFKRISGSHNVFSKTFVKKVSTPTSKSLASRVLQHSINRVLTASVKKKMSKVNTYCMFYNRFGRCNKGTKCTYIHDPSKIAICTRFLRGTCKDQNCLFSHEICPGKMAICSFFLSGSCTKTSCPYRHEMLSPGAELCKAFVKGYCPDGKQCKKAHVLVCPEYVKGFCSKGDACAFPHPPPKEKKITEKPTQKCENVDDDVLMERVSRYFQPSSEEPACNSVVPKRKNLPEQPSFISLSMDDSES